MTKRFLTAILLASVAASATLPVVAALKYGPDGYVQDGLVAHFDGICNAGVGKAHDLFATNWVDLTANHNDAFLVDDAAGAGRWHADGYRFEGKNFFELSKTITLTNTLTIQIVCNVDTNEQNVAWPQLAGAGDNDNCNIYYARGYTPYRLVFKNSGGGSSNLNLMNEIWEGQYATAIRDGATKCLFQTGDGSGGVSGNAGSANIGTLTWWIGAANSAVSVRNNNRLIGKIQAVRIYDRVLTTAELLANRALDDVRFKTGIPVTNAVVATSVRGAEGTEPSGVYAVDGSHTFTAPATVTLGPDTYSCAGYTLEEWDDATDAWGAPVLHSGVLAAEIAEASPKARLTWQWTHSAGPGALDVDDYAQDGLEMFFDGFRNAGRGAPHDPTAAAWANLATANDAPITVGDAESKWKGNGYFFGGGTYGQLVAQQTLGSNYTLQVACDVDTRELFAIRAANGNALRWPHLFGAGATDCCNLYYHLEWNNNGNYPICFKDVTGTRPNIFSWAGRYMTAVRDGRSFKSSQVATMATSASGTATEETGAVPVGKQTWYIATAEGSGGGKAARFLTGTIHAIRLYGRVLTDAELAANHELDEARFWQRPTSNGMVIVSSRVEGLAGNEPNGAYRPVAYAFSAPTATLTVGDKDYQLDGYVVETWDAVRQLWCEPEAGTGNSWTSPAGTDWASRRLTWKWKVVRGLKTYGPDDYVQEGLFLHLDGICNKGVDRPHDMTFASWRDLSWRRSRANINERMPDESGWQDNGYSFAGSNYVESVDSISPGSNITVDVLCNVNLAAQKSQYPTFFSGYGDDAFVFFTRGTGTTLEWKRDVFAGNNNRPKATNWKGRNFVGVLSPTQSILYEDGAARSTTARTSVPTFNPSVWRLMCNGWDWLSGDNKTNPVYNHQAIGTIHAARVYNRPLSATEVAWNHTVDVARYDGILPVTNVVVAAGMYAAAVESPGVYEVEGAWTFSATNAVENGKARRVVGYTVETWSNGAWGTPTKYEGASYSYAVGTSPATVRLTWLWLKDGVSIIVR